MDERARLGKLLLEAARRLVLHAQTGAWAWWVHTCIAIGHMHSHRTHA